MSDELRDHCRLMTERAILAEEDNARLREALVKIAAFRRETTISTERCQTCIARKALENAS